MGKCMRKSKMGAEVSAMEVAPQSCLGVRTRARTLALLRLLKSDGSATSSVAESPPLPETSSYLQLRNRRLEKSSMPSSKVRDPSPSPKHSNRIRVRQAISELVASSEVGDGGVEASLGENFVDSDQRDRSSRETTPCSLVRDSSSSRTPVSTNRPPRTVETTGRAGLISVQRNMPTACEIDEFFARAEQIQQRMFMEKYNFDPVRDCPLPGRYEWVKLDF